MSHVSRLPIAAGSIDAAVSNPLRTTLRKLVEGASVLAAEQEKAKKAEELFLRVRSMSDAELAKLGVDRAHISDYVKKVVY